MKYLSLFITALLLLTQTPSVYAYLSDTQGKLMDYLIDGGEKAVALYEAVNKYEKDGDIEKAIEQQKALLNDLPVMPEGSNQDIIRLWQLYDEYRKRGGKSSAILQEKLPVKDAEVEFIETYFKDTVESIKLAVLAIYYQRHLEFGKAETLMNEAIDYVVAAKNNKTYYYSEFVWGERYLKLLLRNILLIQGRYKEALELQKRIIILLSAEPFSDPMISSTYNLHVLGEQYTLETIQYALENKLSPKLFRYEGRTGVELDIPGRKSWPETVTENEKSGRLNLSNG